MNRQVHWNRKRKAAEDWPHSKTLREEADVSLVRQVLECGQSSAALGFEHSVVDLAP